MNQSLMNQARSCAEHVITRQLTEFWMRLLLVDLSFLLVLKKSYHFQLITIVLIVCSLLVDCDPYHPRSKDEPTDTVVSAMENACKDVSYSNNSHITLELNSHIGLELDSGSEAHTGHDLALKNEQGRISYIIKSLNYTQKIMEKFLDDLGSSIMRSSNMKSSIKVSVTWCDYS
jgi:hypothetical protein